MEAHRTMEKLGKFAQGSDRDENDRIQFIKRTLSQQSKYGNNLSQQMEKMLGVLLHQQQTKQTSGMIPGKFNGSQPPVRGNKANVSCHNCGVR